MSEDRPRVVAATFHNYRRVMNRKVLQIVFEVDLDNEMETLRTLGAPNYEAPNWYAIARLTEKPVAASSNGKTSDFDSENVGSTPTAAATQKERRPFHTLPLATQCALRCGDQQFWQFLDAKIGNIHLRTDTPSEEWATNVVRQIVGVASRGHLGKGDHDADNRWRKLETGFQQWLLDTQYAGSVR